jgi:hypothetical protein
MKNLTKLLGIAVIGAVITMGMAGCDTGNGGGEEEPNLPPITEQTTGRSTIDGSNIALEAGQGIENGSLSSTFVNGLDLTGEKDQNGVTWSVAKGKLTFSLGEPDDTFSVDAETVGSMGTWTDIKVDPTDAEMYVVEGFEFDEEAADDSKYDRIYYTVARRKIETDWETYYNSSQIIYVYVSKDVTASGEKGTDEDDDGRITTYNAFSYSLKKGWNLIQMDTDSTRTSETQSIGIATQNIPWTVNATGGGNDNSGGGN